MIHLLRCMLQFYLIPKGLKINNPEIHFRVIGKKNLTLKGLNKYFILKFVKTNY